MKIAHVRVLVITDKRGGIGVVDFAVDNFLHCRFSRLLA
jgi:hypothetical protein